MKELRQKTAKKRTRENREMTILRERRRCKNKFDKCPNL